MRRKTFIVAEIGINHSGKVSLAKRLIKAAKDAGADAVKFQTFIVREGHSKRYKTRSQIRKEKREEMDFRDFLKIRDYCYREKIIFFSTPFDIKSVNILEDLNVPFYKVASPEIINIPLLKKIATTCKSVIISTGMASMKEIKSAVNLFKRCFDKNKVKTDKNLTVNYKCFDSNIILLHCVSLYPTDYDKVNLHCIGTLRRMFNKCHIGFSDHTLGMEVSLAAVALGATMIEKHFTIDRALKGSDHKLSMMPEEFKAMVKGIRNIERALGDGKKRISREERVTGSMARKGIVACRDILKGEIITEENIAVKRPAKGINPSFYYSLLGRRVDRNILEDEAIRFKDLR